MKKPKRLPKNKFRCSCCNKLILNKYGEFTGLHPWGKDYSPKVCFRCIKKLQALLLKYYETNLVHWEWETYEKAR